MQSYNGNQVSACFQPSYHCPGNQPSKNRHLLVDVCRWRRHCRLPAPPGARPRPWRRSPQVAGRLWEPTGRRQDCQRCTPPLPPPPFPFAARPAACAGPGELSARRGDRRRNGWRRDLTSNTARWQGAKNRTSLHAAPGGAFAAIKRYTGPLSAAEDRESLGQAAATWRPLPRWDIGRLRHEHRCHNKSCPARTLAGHAGRIQLQPRMLDLVALAKVWKGERSFAPNKSGTLVAAGAVMRPHQNKNEQRLKCQ